MTRESDNGDDGGDGPDNQDQEPEEGPPKIRPQSALSTITLAKDILPMIAFLLLPAFALRALVVARFDLTVAIALVQFTQPLSFLLTFLLDTLPLLMYALGLIVLFGTGRSYREGIFVGPFPAMQIFLLALLLSVPLFMTLPFPEYPVYAILLVFLAGTMRAGKLQSLGKNKNLPQLLRSAKTAQEFDRKLGIIKTQFYLRCYLVGIVIILVISAGRGMWVAPEVLMIRGVPTKQYVLQQQDRDLIVYDSNLYTILRLSTSDVSYRQFCSIRSFTVAERLLGGPQGRPPCPE